MKSNKRLQGTEVLQGRPFYLWRSSQGLFFLLGALLIFSLVFFPGFGINAFWNVLIPLTPLTLVLFPGLWRNICPMSFVSLLPHRWGISARKRLKVDEQGRFMLIGVCFLYLIIPFRHVILDTNGPATASVLMLLATGAFFSGLHYDWKSGWCSGLCPVHPVERLYGSRPMVSFSNAQCTTCRNCVIPCPDSEVDTHPLSQQKSSGHRLSGILLIGGFPGLIWGWFHVPDYHGADGWQHLIQIFGLPYLGMVVSLALFYGLYKCLPPSYIRLLIRLFAAAALILYYWYRIPALLGFGMIPGDGMLVDLTQMLPGYTPYVLQLAALAFFTFWCLCQPDQSLNWKMRPPFEKRQRV